MFGRMMNSFYYGKSGKGDFRREDLPKNRMQLFREMLRVRISALFRLNLMCVVAFLPLIIVFAQGIMTLISGMNGFYDYDQAVLAGDLSAFTEEQIKVYSSFTFNDLVKNVLFSSCLWLIPCILITGPVQVGMAYVTRNWARDEHAFIWSDFKDAVKENWKQALGVSAITSVLPIILYVCWNFYGQMANENMFFIVPQVLTVSLGLVWALGMTFMYPMMVSYKMTFREIVKNGILLAIARLPQTVGIRLALLVLIAVCVVVLMFTSVGMYALLILAAYYILVGYAFSRFVIASYTNAVFDKFINSHIEGAQVNRGLSKDEDEEDEEEGTPDEAGDEKPAEAPEGQPAHA